MFGSVESTTYDPALYGVHLPPICKTGAARGICINNDPREQDVDYVTYQFSSTNHRLDPTRDNVTRGQRTSTPTTSSNKRSKLSENSSPSESITISIPKQAFSDYEIQTTVLEDLKHQNLPVSIIFAYIVNFVHGTLCISYPPTLDELMLYARVRALHKVLGTNADRSTYVIEQLFDALITLPHFGTLSSDTVIEFLRYSWSLDPDEWILEVVAPFLNTPLLLERAFSAIMTPTTSMKSFATLAFATLKPPKKKGAAEE